MAKSRVRKKKKTIFSSFNNEIKFIKEKARSYPVETCIITKDYNLKGLAQCLVTRRVAEDKLILGCYLVDIFCLGIKNCIVRVVNNAEALRMIGIIKETEPFMNCDWNLFQNIVYGAQEYAEELGFYPNKDFATGKYILDDLDDLEYIEVEFGKAGKPFFISGPFDNVDKIIATLNRSVGEGNYDVLIQLSEDDWEDDWEDDEQENDEETVSYEVIEEDNTNQEGNTK